MNCLASMANFRLHENHGCKLPVSLDLIAVGLRQLKPSSEVSPMQLGNCVTAVFTSIPNQFETTDDHDEVRARFWSMAREQSSALEDRVKNDMTKFARSRATASLDDFNGLMFHLSISNIGVVDLKGYGCFENDEFYIENMFTTVTNSISNDKFLCVLYFTTIGDRLFCSLGTNSFFFDPIVADEFVDIFKKLIDFVI